MSIIRKTQIVLCCIILFIGFLFQAQLGAQNGQEIEIIPLPNKIEKGNGVFEFNQQTVLIIDSQSQGFQKLKMRFIEELKNEVGYELRATPPSERKNSILVKQNNLLAPEAYVLRIKDDQIQIESSSPAGAYYALQTIKQLIPIEAKNLMNDQQKILIPCVNIEDEPAFGWRGFMLDVSRHFFDKEEVMKVLDFMADLKLNRFHWHLADDQGWRVEIKKYPELTSVGAWRVNYTIYDETVSNWWGRPVQKEGERATYGGYYTQSDIKEIIAYAQERYIEVLPEIDVPGHSQEILASYPMVACDDRSYKVATGGVYKDNALCASKDETYQLLEEVLGEVMDLFPFEYIHIGGDECNKEGWKNHESCQALIKEKGLENEVGLQSYFIRRVEKMINAKGKSMIGWDEILDGGLAPNATVMSWRGEKGGIAAARQGHNVIMSPNYANYLDLKQGQPDFEPNLGYSEALLSTSYNYSVIPDELSKEEAQFIMGTQGNLWTESISDWDKLTYMTFPRLFAVAENAWTHEVNQDFGDFIQRLHPHLESLNATGVRYANSVFNVWVQHKGNGKSIDITLSSEVPNADIRYTIDGSTPTSSSSKYNGPFAISKTTTIQAATFQNNQILGNVTKVEYPFHKAAGAKVTNVNDSQAGDKVLTLEKLTDLGYGQLLAKGDEHWQSFQEDMEVDIHLAEIQNIQSVSLTSLKATISVVYPPRQIEVFGSADGVEFHQIGDSGFIQTSHIQGRNKITTMVECPAKNIKVIRVKAYKLDPIPDGHHRAGQKSILRIDEIVVE